MTERSVDAAPQLPAHEHSAGCFAAPPAERAPAPPAVELPDSWACASAAALRYFNRRLNEFA